MRLATDLLRVIAKFELFLIFGFFLFPSFTYLSPIFGIIDELVTLSFLIIILFKSLVIKIGSKYFNSLLLIFIAYAVFLIFKNKIPKQNLFQILITIKFIVIYLYFNYKSFSYKETAFNYFIKLFVLIYISSLFISILQFTIPSLFKAASDSRGINGITLNGIFFSRTLYSQFLVFSIIITLTLKDYNNPLNRLIINNKNKIVIMTLLLLFLTFTRKELLFGLFITYLLYIKTSSKSIIKLINVLFFFVILMLPIISNIFFSEINKKTFKEDQVRLLILNSGLQVLDYYAPLGSGPGTFGSIMSVNYDKVYKQFNVPTRIYKGLKNQERGPIFDVFFVSLLTEYGIGILFFYLCYRLMYKAQFHEEHNEKINIKNLRFTTLIYIIIASLTVPLLNNIVGYLMFSFLGLTTLSHKKLV